MWFCPGIRLFLQSQFSNDSFMQLIKLTCFLFLLIGASFSGFCQSELDVAMPDEENALLIDKIIEITQYKQYYNHYCTARVQEYAQAHSWTKAQTAEILKSIRFRDFASSIHNNFAIYTNEQLSNLLQALTAMVNQAKYRGSFILINEVLQNNLDVMVNSIIQGKYVIKEK